MKTPGFEARFSQNLAPVGARKATKPLPCLHFTFIQPTLCMLAYYVEWHLKQSLAPLLFKDEEIDDSSLNVIKASRSESVQSKERKKRNQENLPVHSFRTLLEDLGTICLNTVECTIREGSYRFSKITRPTSLQQSCVRFIGSFPNLYPVTGRWKFS
jgi:hypothetical protein